MKKICEVWGDKWHHIVGSEKKQKIHYLAVSYYRVTGWKN